MHFEMYTGCFASSAVSAVNHTDVLPSCQLSVFVSGESVGGGGLKSNCRSVKFMPVTSLHSGLYSCWLLLKAITFKNVRLTR